MPFLILLLTVATYASVWNGKADTKWYKDSESEFTITTPEQLAGLAKLVNGGNKFENKTVKLGANIMLNDTANWQNWEKKKPKNKWKPIGFEKYKYYGAIGHVTLSNTTSNYFSGIFDGNGFVVSGVYVDSDEYAGLFGHIVRGTIKNLGVTASYIKGGGYTGGLVGNFKSGTMINCYFSGTVIGSWSVGGLTGNNTKGKVIDSYSTGMVTGKERVGGLVGASNSGHIIGGYSTSTVVGDTIVGGLVGANSGTIINSYSNGTVTGREVAGGLVGIMYSNEIIGSYSSSMVAGGSTVGGFVGYIRRDGEIVNSYYDKETSRQDYGIGEVEIIGKYIIKGKSSAEMKRKEIYNDWDFDKTWGIDSKVNGGYPHLRTE